jgi:hypothetical protein
MRVTLPPPEAMRETTRLAQDSSDDGADRTGPDPLAGGSFGTGVRRRIRNTHVPHPRI